MGYEILLYRKDRNVCHAEPRSQDIYKGCSWSWTFLAGGTNSTFNRFVLKRYFMSRTGLLPLSMSWMIQKMKLPSRKDRTDGARVREAHTPRAGAARGAATRGQPRRSRSLARTERTTLFLGDQLSPTAPGCGPSCSLALARPRAGTATPTPPNAPRARGSRTPGGHGP
uniref:Large ribosomal subunit protein uL15/eL18 domain-containing protein n=1 Tax=Catagonus wagneri TaxID=51154 RepID=A0A8C3WE81_9CETA